VGQHRVGFVYQRGSRSAKPEATATAETAGGFLRSRLVEHNLLLTITERLRRVDRPGPGEPPLLGWWADGPAAGGVRQHRGIPARGDLHARPGAR
jgi:hypothetical protein